jgi:hypothetical protein
MLDNPYHNWAHVFDVMQTVGPPRSSAHPLDGMPPSTRDALLSACEMTFPTTRCFRGFFSARRQMLLLSMSLASRMYQAMWHALEQLLVFLNRGAVHAPCSHGSA